MGQNTRIISDRVDGGVLVEPPSGITHPPVEASALTDAAGNLAKFTDNGDGTATLEVKVATGAETRTDKSSLVNDVATDSTGDKLTYTVPAGKTARITHVTWRNNSGAPTVDIRLARGGTTYVLKQFTNDLDAAVGYRLQAGDVIALNVSTIAVATSTADASIHIEEKS